MWIFLLPRRFILKQSLRSVNIHRAEKTIRFLDGLTRNFATDHSIQNEYLSELNKKPTDLSTAAELNGQTSSETSINSLSNTLPGVPVERTGLQSDELGDASKIDWSRSYFGLSAEPFSKEIANILQSPLDTLDIEVKPDGLIYLPEIKYRRILNKAFGPGGWGLAPRGETTVGPKVVSREYALVCLGRYV